MKRTLSLASALLLAAMGFAQPGPPYKTYNLNNMQEPFGGYTQQYYADSTTLESSYAGLEEHPGITELSLSLDHIPAGLIAHGRYIQQLNMLNPDHDRTGREEWPVLYDLELLNYMPSLQHVYLRGYKIDHRPDSVAKKLGKCPGDLISVLDQTESERKAFDAEYARMIYPPTTSAGPATAVMGISDVEIIRFPSGLCIRSVSLGNIFASDPSGIQQNNYIKFVTLAGSSHRELPGWLPPAIEYLSVNNCDSLTSIQNLEQYKNLQSISVHGCFRLKTFPSFLHVKKLERLDVHLHPQFTSDLMAALTGIDTIEEMEFEFYEGMAEVDFKNLWLHAGRLMISGSSLRNKTAVELANLQNISVGDLHLSGKYITIPDVSVMRRLDEFHLHAYSPITDSASMKMLTKIKNLRKFSLTNYQMPVFPEVFFENNPHLTYIGLVGTGIKKLSFGKTVLAELKHLYLRRNMELEKIPPKRFYPNAWKPDAHENKKKEYVY